MKKDSNYWNAHKEVYMEELDSLDDSIRNTIQTKPSSPEARLFNERVTKKIKDRLKDNSQFVR